MTTAVGFGLLLLVGGTIALFLALWRWLQRPPANEETVEALWNTIAALHESIHRLELTVARLERLQNAGNGKHSYLREGGEQ